jgi:NAD(P)-dependent dehydrogenase (short-subunit alcohol dehydrogenase family)
MTHEHTISGNGFRKGDVVVVTGAADGIGRALALRLARSGARLALFDIDEEKGLEAEALARAEGATAIFYKVDIGIGAEIEAAMAKVKAEFGTVFALINNAAIFPRALVMDTTEALWQRVLAVNLIGAVTCSREAIPMMREAGRGVIINVSSGAGMLPKPKRAHYAASKAGLIAFTKSLAVEVAPTIRVLCVLPGLTETAQPLQDMTREQLHARGAQIPMGRAAQPEDLGPLVSFLLSSDADYITGQTMACDGGMQMLP